MWARRRGGGLVYQCTYEIYCQWWVGPGVHEIYTHIFIHTYVYIKNHKNTHRHIYMCVRTAVTRFPPQAASVKSASPTTSRQNWPDRPSSFTAGVLFVCLFDVGGWVGVDVEIYKYT